MFLRVFLVFFLHYFQPSVCLVETISENERKDSALVGRGLC